jgi:hypothetical protein
LGVDWVGLNCFLGRPDNYHCSSSVALKKVGFEKALIPKRQYKHKRNEADNNENQHQRERVCLCFSLSLTFWCGHRAGQICCHDVPPLWNSWCTIVLVATEATPVTIKCAENTKEDEARPDRAQRGEAAGAVAR